ncbi:uncharacterized protein LOC125472541 [Pyrus x bretschneideri]|uniref:uncharacterized protein LOC125472541 n=1 Tax=Pyrus x bretschneideri TaxID=225117 RepID=UPI00202F4AEC|nr:uncharacterized protein LOC125472541 [Pyrus x bretschneideri]
MTNSSSIYYVVSAWDKFRQSKPTVGWSKPVWYNQNIPKMSFILWLSSIATSSLSVPLPMVFDLRCYSSAVSLALFVMWATSRCKGKSLSSIVLKLDLPATVYYVWRERNNRRFKNSSQPAAMVLNSIKSTIRLRLSSLKIAHSAANDSTLREWNMIMNS